MSIKLVILDRDGVINEDSEAFVKTADEWRPIPRSLEAIARLNQAGYRVVALSPRADAVPMDELFAEDVPERVALMLGTEGPGLLAATMDRADDLCRVEMAPGFDSLNVATTSGIALHHVMVRQQRA